MTRINPWIVILVMSFAFSSWIDLMGVWVEFPILVHLLPEGWNLPSYVVVLVQCAMITPIAYSVVNKICPGNTQRREVFMAYFIMAIGFLALLMLSIFWQETVHIAGADRSLAALTLIFLLSMVDTTSCIVYLPYMSRFKEHYIPAYIAGEESGGLITGVVGLIQGAGGEAVCNNVTVHHYNETLRMNYTEHMIDITHREPRFSVTVFFVFLMFMMALSALSFSILNFSTFAKREKVGKFGLQPESKELEATIHGVLILLCATLMWCSFFIFGLFPTLQSYSTLPYGSMTYTLGVRLICVFNPLAALLALFVRMRSVAKLLGLVVLSSVLVVYHIVLATMSPHPPLKHTALGSFIVVFTAITLAACNAYARACITTLLRSEGGHRALLLGGGAIQAGAFFGGIMGFLLVNVFSLFEHEPPCGNL
ncbi:hypothetical protein CAPTEDRAFT_142040 [Capitella teleta]|uniref:Riboflavin transporter n=1 Tax=Capitella teleta TaxID=283909 RepID=R7TZD4_CAPTE|nr:hypothetical protein CAPTEDRAFT_142040 [Capitella teleta]|eukprot:ELT99129.1 hypothetical protein CAPTEDRAFT_142040 [Capitella teleta]